MPIPLRWLVPTVLKRAFGKQLHARGMGRHSEDVIIEQGKADLDALAELLGDQPYLLGDRPASIDACVFGFLGVSLYVAGDNPLYQYGASLDNLMRYCERMRARYFPETLSTLAPMFSNEAYRRSRPARLARSSGTEPGFARGASRDQPGGGRAGTTPRRCASAALLRSRLPFAHRVLTLLDHLGIAFDQRQSEVGDKPEGLADYSRSGRIPLLVHGGSSSPSPA